MPLQLKKLHKKFGAEIINFNLSKKLNNQYFKEILGILVIFIDSKFVPLSADPVNKR